jgi:hypothetical protein
MLSSFQTRNNRQPILALLSSPVTTWWYSTNVFAAKISPAAALFSYMRRSRGNKL